MKKSLLAVAAMTAFAGAAHAQSSVTIYGVLDESYSSVKQTAFNGMNKTVQGLKDSAWTSNRLGFQGSEDMGGGTSTVFTVETGLSVGSSDPGQAGLGVTGATNNATAPFQNVRQAFLGLNDTKYGQLTAGYQYTQEYFQRITNIGGSANTLGMAATSSGNGGIAVASRGTIDQMNGFRYQSPTFYGAQAVAMIGTINTTQQSGFATAIIATASSTGASLLIPAITGDQAVTQTGFGQQYGVQWSQGKAQATVSYSQERVSNSSPYSYYLGSAGSAGPNGVDLVGVINAYKTSQQNFTGSGSYDFGIVKLMAVAANRRVTDLTAATAPVTNVDMYNIGAFVPVTSAIKLGANYAYAHQGAKGADSKNQAVQASVQYAMSKRTSAYLLAARAFASTIAGAPFTATNAVTSVNQYSLGLMHNF